MSNGMKVIEHNESIMKVAREDATWLGVVDIYEAAPVEVEIEAVVKFKDGVFDRGRKEDGQALRLKGVKKLLRLNRTNTRTLWEKHGKSSEELKGKKITLVVEKLDRPFQGHTHGIRIK